MIDSTIQRESMTESRRCTRPFNSIGSEHAHRPSEDAGAALILALVFLLAIGLLTMAIASFAVEADTNTSNVRAVGTVNLNAESVAMATIQAVRRTWVYPGETAATTQYYSPGASGTTAVNCTPTQINSPFFVSCIGYSQPGTPATRVVDFYVCATANINPATNAASCSGNNQFIALFAEVTFDDVPPNQQPSAAACSAQYPGLYPPGTSQGPDTCGITMAIDRWDVRLADS